jgi:hypothetical protein
VKDKFDATVFRETLLPALAASEYDEALKFLEKGEIIVDGQVEALDYRTYADALFDILICGGTLGELHGGLSLALSRLPALSLCLFWWGCRVDCVRCRARPCD